ncbi:MAG: 30S ribosome-binding factor RbfA [Candidatus Omnitrophica bacterium]|nr:30S ribosome-binding factor RbfA [Candidatus Omnitrophota bacterium]MBU1922962.1 30S ribosome-binding factor RbfA [Candidatus Omnitrophota bacterium]
MSRHERVEEAIKKEVSLIIHDKLKDPRIGFVTITRVELTKDLRNAKIFYSVLGKEEDHKKTKLALGSALGYIRSLVAQRINMRFATELMFQEDYSVEYSVRIEEVLNKIRELDQPRDSSKRAVKLNKGKEGQDSGPKKNLRRHKKV